jgi:hypothetical protein
MTGNGSGPVRGEGGTPLSHVPVTVLISADYTGRIDVTVAGPIKGKAGLLYLLDGVKRIVDEWPDDRPLPRPPRGARWSRRPDSDPPT